MDFDKELDRYIEEVEEILDEYDKWRSEEEVD